MRLNFWDFRLLGREQYIVQPNLARRLFLLLFGPLGVNARIRSARAINTILQLDLPEAANILDVGCGHAYALFWLAQHFPKYKLVGVDIDSIMIDDARQISKSLGLTNITFLHTSALGINDINVYDLIFSLDVLEHVNEDNEALQAMRKALRPSGHLFLHLPRRHYDQKRFLPAFKNYTTPDHVRDEYTPDEIGYLLTQNGFFVEDLHYGYGKWGELAFESNYLFWNSALLRTITAIVLHPIAVGLAYMEINHDYTDGNSLLILARPANG